MEPGPFEIKAQQSGFFKAMYENITAGNIKKSRELIELMKRSDESGKWHEENKSNLANLVLTAAQFPKGNKLLPMLVAAGYPLQHDTAQIEDLPQIAQTGRNALHMLAFSKGFDTEEGKYRKPWINAYQVLISKGLTLNDRDMYGMTPVALAIMSGHRQEALFMIEEGADVHVECKIGKSLLGFTYLDGQEGGREPSELAQRLFDLGVSPRDQDFEDSDGEVVQALHSHYSAFVSAKSVAAIQAEPEVTVTPTFERGSMFDRFKRPAAKPIAPAVRRI